MCVSFLRLLPPTVLTPPLPQAYIPNVEVGHVAAGLTPAQVTEQLSQIRGHLVQAANEFLIEEDDLVSGLLWATWDPLLPLWV
jgi:hypothetical protein